MLLLSVLTWRLTPIEARACGTPVIGSAVGGIKTTVVDGKTRFLVPPNEPDRLADWLADLLPDPARRRAFGRRADQHVNAHDSWSNVAQAIDELYEVVLGRHRNRRVDSGVGLRAPQTIRLSSA